jgi:hypothetical protein
VSAALIVKLHDDQTNNPSHPPFVPVIVSSAGLNDLFTSEMTLTNKGSADVTIELSYAAALVQAAAWLWTP